MYELGPVELSVGDLFAREAATEERPGVDRFLVRPRIGPGGRGPPPRHARWRRSGPVRPDRGPVAVCRHPRVLARRSAQAGPPAGERPPRPAHGQALRAVARPRGPRRARRPDRVGPGLGNELRRRGGGGAVRGRRVAGPGRWPWSERRSGSPQPATTARRADSPSCRCPRRPARRNASSTSSRACRRTRRRRSSGCIGTILARRAARHDGRRRSPPGIRHPTWRTSGGSSDRAVRSSSSAAGRGGVADAARARAAGLTARSARLDGPWRTASHLAVTG